MGSADPLGRGRDAFASRRWGAAHEHLTAADRQAPLEPADLERLAVASALLGREDESDEVRARAYRAHVKRSDPEAAARSAFWLGLSLLQRGEHARGGGWLARAHQHVEEAGPDCVERGFLMVPPAIQALDGGDFATARELFENVAAIAGARGDPDLEAMGLLGRGRSLIKLGEVERGLAFLDELMVPITGGEVSPIFCGIAFCAAIDACQEAFDIKRGQEWTVALTRWCEEQPDLVPFRGRCLVHKAELMQLHGDWRSAAGEALRACELLAGHRGPQWDLALAHYRTAELSRLRGDFGRAEEEYRIASQHGHDPQPGLALLRLAQGKIDAAESAIRRVAAEARDPVVRASMLPAFVEIVLAVDDVAAARAAADELAEIAADRDVPTLRARAAFARGAVLLAEGDARDALAPLREAWRVSQEIEVPYEGARARVLIGLAYRHLGDEDGAEMELDAARWVFQQLGAEPDLARLEHLSTRAAPRAAGGLTVREVEVLRLVATGKSNRAIADELVISQKTVARHVSNIFTKLGLSSRAAATAYAYERGLL